VQGAWCDVRWALHAQLYYTRCRGDSDDLPVLVRIRDGRVAEIVEKGVALQSWDFAVKGTAEGWSKFWLATPPAGWHDLLALNKRRVFTIEGHLHPLMAHLQFIKDLLASPREVAA